MSTGTEARDQANRAGMDPLRLVVIFLILGTIIVGLFLEHLLGMALAALNVSNPALVEQWTAASVAAFVVAAGLAVFVYVSPRLRAFATDVASELMKVTWPSWPEVRGSTVAVVVASVVAAILLFGIDNIALRLMVDWLPALWARL